MTNGQLLWLSAGGTREFWRDHIKPDRKELFEQQAARYEALKAERDADAIRANIQQAIDEMDPEIADARNNHGQDADAIAALHNAYPELAAEIRRLTEEVDEGQLAIDENRALRAELAVVKDERDRQYEFNAGSIAKLAAFELQRDALRAHVERLRAAAEEVVPVLCYSGWPDGIKAALAATPAQSLASVKADALREVARLVDSHACEILMAEADRIAKEAANG